MLEPNACLEFGPQGPMLTSLRNGCWMMQMLSRRLSTSEWNAAASNPRMSSQEAQEEVELHTLVTLASSEGEDEEPVAREVGLARLEGGW